MLSTSGVYTYNTPESRIIIDNAYRRIGIDPAKVTQQQVIAAQEFGNIALQSWPNRGINLWLRRTAMITLIPYQYMYALPLYTSSVREVTRRTSVRDVTPTGIPFSNSGGVAANAFDGDPATACTQTAPNGYISYQWPLIPSSVPIPLQPQNTGAQIITLVGVTSNVSTNYTLTFSYSQDGIDWTPVLVTPLQAYTKGLIQWFEIMMPAFAFYFRCLETGGATLDIQELYFNNQVIDIPLTGISESQYMRYPNKTFPNASAPSNFFVDRQINPNIYLYPAPSPQYNNLFFSYQQQIQDMGQMTNYVQIPARFINALTAEIAYYISFKEAPDKTSMLEADLTRQVKLAHNEDRERVPLKMVGNYQQGGGY